MRVERISRRRNGSVRVAVHEVQTEEMQMAAFTMAHFETDDYDAWKETFDSDRGGRKQAAEGHVISRRR